MWLDNSIFEWLESRWQLDSKTVKCPFAVSWSRKLGKYIRETETGIFHWFTATYKLIYSKKLSAQKLSLKK